MAFHPNAQKRLLTSQKLNALETFSNSLTMKRPWDSIIEFAVSDKFCGQKLYPRQQTLLRLIYLETEQMTPFDLDVIEQWRLGFTSRREVFGVQPDIWERVKLLKSLGYTHFPHVLAVLGRRASKGFIGGLIGAERFAYMYSLDSWQHHFNLSPGAIGWCQVTATSQSQAKRTQFADIRFIVENCRYLQEAVSISKESEFSVRTPADLRQIAEMQAKGVTIEHEIASLRCLAQSANSGTTRGVSTFMLALDEFAYMIFGSGSTKSGEEIYDAAEPSLDQFGVHRMIYVPSSPFTKIGRFFELYRTGSVLMPVYKDGAVELQNHTESSLHVDAENEIADLTAEPEMLVFQGPSWVLYDDWEKSPSLGGPKFKRAVQVYDDRMKRLQSRNPEKFGVERLGQFADVQDQYLDPVKVDQMFDPPGWRDDLQSQDRGTLNRQYIIHCDPGRTNANFAIAIGHLEDAPPDEYDMVWPHVIFDYLHVWQPQNYADHTIDYREVKLEIISLLKRFNSTEKISFDQWNSASMIADIKYEFSPTIRVIQENFTSQANQARFEKFKSAMNLGWVHAYRDEFGDAGTCLLEQELKFLSEVNGKVDKQSFGPITTKDLADCVMVVSTALLHNALDQWVKRLGMNNAFGSTDVAGMRHGRELERLSQLGMGERKISRARQQLVANKLDRLRGDRSGKNFILPTRGGRYR